MAGQRSSAALIRSVAAGARVNSHSDPLADVFWEALGNVGQVSFSTVLWKVTIVNTLGL
jgi:hypothetical protein